MSRETTTKIQGKNLKRFVPVTVAIAILRN
jgi:hypothetical protein